jgi:hypothetical protein
MVKKRITICLMCVVVLGTGRVAGMSKSVKTEMPATSVGLFDSRAVAGAWYRSKAHMKQVMEMKAEYKKAKASGDEKLAAELEKKGSESQEAAHRQVFSNEPIDDVLKRIEKDLPGIAKAAGVDMLVSKWEIAYQDRSAKFADVTLEMVNLFEPNEATITLVKEILESEPVPMKDGKFVSKELPKTISKKELKEIYKEFSITTKKDSFFNKKAERILVTYDVHERLVDVFAHSFEHSLVSAFKSNGTEAVIVKPESPKAEGFKTDATMHIDIEPLYRKRKDGYQAIVGIKFKVSLTETATGKEVWRESGKVDYIRMFGANYTAHEGIRKEFAWHTTAAVACAFASEINGQEPARIYTDTESRQEHGQQTD